jgi:biopolymer transport protein ExbB
MKASITLSLLLLLAVPAAAQSDFNQASSSAEADLQKSLEQLAALRNDIAGEKLPLTRQLSDVERRLKEVRAEYEEISRLLDTRNLDLNNLKTDLKSSQDERTYLSNLLDEYVRNFEARLHIAELQRYRDRLEAARLAPENDSFSPADVYRAQTGMVDLSLDRLIEQSGGATFPGQAVAEDGRVHDVSFALVGPVALYRTDDGAGAGLAEQRLGSLEPNMVPFDNPELTEHAGLLVAGGSGKLPFDPTMGNASKVEATKDSLFEHISKGGPVMIPILLLALSALAVAIMKWIQLARVPSPSRKQLDGFLAAVKSRDNGAIKSAVAAVAGPTGDMLRAGVENLKQPKQLVEEMMYEQVLETRLRLQRYLTFIAVCAAAAPLLGLLGTVTGIINTFKLITVFGTGDARTLSSGISEALITTEFGLIVAIPALFFHAFLSRKAKRFVDGMEKTGVSFMNRILGRPDQEPPEPDRPGLEQPAAAVAEAK